MAKAGLRGLALDGQLLQLEQSCLDVLSAAHTELSPNLQLELWEQS